MRKAAAGLSAMGKGFEVIHTGKKRIICSVASELNEDHKILFKLAEESGGWFSRSSAKSELQFDEQRFQRSVEKLIREGIVWIDDQHVAQQGEKKNTFGMGGERIYWFPSLCQI